jgi:hypothetical protein
MEDTINSTPRPSYTPERRAPMQDLVAACRDTSPVSQQPGAEIWLEGLPHWAPEGHVCLRLSSGLYATVPIAAVITCEAGSRGRYRLALKEDALLTVSIRRTVRVAPIG